MSLNVEVNKSFIENATIYISGHDVNFKNSLEQNLGKYLDDVDQEVADRVLHAYKDFLSYGEFDDNEYDLDTPDGGYLSVTDYFTDDKIYTIVLCDGQENPINKVFELKDIK